MIASYSGFEVYVSRVRPAPGTAGNGWGRGQATPYLVAKQQVAERLLLK